MECVEICMENKQISKKKILDEVQMKFYKNRIPSHSIMLYTFSIVTHY